jgi:predicted histone-like DNA-binding protein
MPVGYKKMLKRDPRDPQAPRKYYPQLVTQGKNADLDDVAFMMKELSSLSVGDIKSVLTNFIGCTCTLLYTGQSVRIAGFGTFSLSAQTTGEETKAACGVKNIKSVKINFRAATNVKPDVSSTRAGERIKFYDIMTGVVENIPAIGGEETDEKTGGEETGGEETGGENTGGEDQSGAETGGENTGGEGSVDPNA